MSFSKLAAVMAALLLALGLPLVAGAKEESKIQVPLVDDSDPGNGNGKAKGRNDGKMQSTFTETQATFHVHAKQLDPDVGYRVLARESEPAIPGECETAEECEASEGCEVIHESTEGSNGQVKLKIDLLQTGDETHPPIDPRGKLISICQGAEIVMSSWFYGAADDDTPHTKVKEQTELEPVNESTQGSVSARYDMGPNGKESLSLQFQNVAPGTYAIYVDGAPVYLNADLDPADLTPNAGGTAKLSLRSHPGKGKGSGKVKEHNKKGTLPSDLDPRRKLIEVMLGGEPAFSGPMLAQIPGLNDCGLGDESTIGMKLGPDFDPVQVDMAGDVTIGVDESCSPIFGVAISGATASDLPVDDYTLRVDGFDSSRWCRARPSSSRSRFLCRS
jgi:hypothetical protein